MSLLNYYTSRIRQKERLHSFGGQRKCPVNQKKTVKAVEVSNQVIS